MEVPLTAKIVIGVVFAAVGLGLLVTSGGERGFGQRRQGGVLLLIAGTALAAAGLGLIERPW